MIDRASKNVLIFEDTMKMIEGNKRLAEAVEASLAGQKIYREGEEIAIGEAKVKECKTIISTKRSFEAAADYARAGKKVCVLNFASSTNPGGGVTKGSSAQEEALCRCSTLYFCLKDDKLWEEFYLPHRLTGNPLYNDDCVYTPGIMVIKNDVSAPKRMEEKDWYQVDVITCAAPNLRKRPSNRMNPNAGNVAVKLSKDELYELLIKRIEQIFRLAAYNGAEVLILGAFGCGAFANPPEVAAKAFFDVQQKYENCFDIIEYAIFCRDYETENYDAFKRVWKGIEGN